MINEGVSDMTAAWNQGFNMYLAYMSWKLEAGVNPYDVTTQLEEYKDWEAGWRAADMADYDQC